MFRKWITVLVLSLIPTTAQAEVMLFYFSGPNCPFCMKMNREVWPRQDVLQLLADRRIRRHIRDPEIFQEDAQNWQIQTMPTTILVDITTSGAVELGRITGIGTANDVKGLIGNDSN